MATFCNTFAISWLLASLIDETRDNSNLCQSIDIHSVVLVHFVIKEKFEDAIRIHQLKQDRQYNDQKDQQ